MTRYVIVDVQIPKDKSGMKVSYVGKDNTLIGEDGVSTWWIRKLGYKTLFGAMKNQCYRVYEYRKQHKIKNNDDDEEYVHIEEWEINE